MLPGEADAGPRASFTHLALPSTPPGSRDVVTLTHRSKRGVAPSHSVTVVYEIPASHSYRVMAAQLSETVTGDRPGSSLGTCPDFHSEQTTATTLGAQAPPAAQPGSNGHLLQGPDGFIGQITATGDSAVATNLRGCDLGANPPASCTRTGAATIAKDVGFDIALPNVGPATLRRRFESFPGAGLGGEGRGLQLAGPADGLEHRGRFLRGGAHRAPRGVRGHDAPDARGRHRPRRQDPNPAGAAQIHAVEHYTVTIQRVKDDGSPL